MPGEVCPKPVLAVRLYLWKWVWFRLGERIGGEDTPRRVYCSDCPKDVLVVRTQGRRKESPEGRQDAKNQGRTEESPFGCITMPGNQGRTEERRICREGEIISETDLREMQNHQAQRQYQSNL